MRALLLLLIASGCLVDQGDDEEVTSEPRQAHLFHCTWRWIRHNPPSDGGGDSGGVIWPGEGFDTCTSSAVQASTNDVEDRCTTRWNDGNLTHCYVSCHSIEPRVPCNGD